MSAATVVLTILWLAPDLAISAATRSTVWVRAGDRASGTGWVVDRERRWIVTARHVLGDRDTVDLCFVDGEGGRVANDRRHYLTERHGLKSRGRLVSARLVSKRDAADLALLVADSIPSDIPVLRLANHRSQSGDHCFSVGHRHDSEVLWTVTTGHVRQVGHLTEGYHWAGKQVGQGVGVLLVQSRIEAGESGAAIANRAGHVIGVVSAISGRTPGVAIAIDAAEIAALLADARGDKSTPVPVAREQRADVLALSRATVWVRPQATDGQYAGVLIDRQRRLILTSAAAVGGEAIVSVVAPIWEKERLVAEADRYRDHLGLCLSGHSARGMVLARDRARDLALIELDSLPATLSSLSAVKDAPGPGERIAVITHPTGEELMWLYAAGTVRATGQVGLDRDAGDKATRVKASLLQLPHQGSSSGGPIVNERGELVGILATREGARQELAYAALPDEVRAFLDDARPLTHPETAEDWHRRGKFLVRRGQMVRGIEALRTAVAKVPKNPEFLTDLAQSLTTTNRSDEVRQLVERALSLDPPAKSLASLADLFLRLDDRERASDLVARALKHDPRDSAALVVRSDLRTGNEAERDRAAAIEYDPTYAPAYIARACRADTENADGLRVALAAWSRVIELQPADVDSRRQRAVLYFKAKEHKKAAADWLRLTEMEPLKADHWFGLADAQFLAGDRSSSARSLSAAVRIPPGRAVEAFGTILRNGKQLRSDNPGDPARAADWYEAALRQLVVWSTGTNQTAIERALAEAQAEPAGARRADLLEKRLSDWARAKK